MVAEVALDLLSFERRHLDGPRHPVAFSLLSPVRRTMDHIPSPLPDLADNLPLPQRTLGSLRWLDVDARQGFVLALLLVCCVAVLDYVTGYELRLAILYLLPIALSTWTGGPRAGMLIVAAASVCWLITFRSTHAYSREIYFYWEGLVMFAVYILFVWLLARLRIALRRADERFLRVLEELHAGVYVIDHDRSRIVYANRRLTDILDKDPFSMAAADLEARLGGGMIDEIGEPSSRSSRPGEARFVSREVRDAETGRWYLVQAGPVPWKRNRRVSLKVITDISAQKHSQSLKQQHRDMLHQTARLAALTEIASTLAHEINQPLMAIASYNDACLRLLRRSEPDRDDMVTALEKCRGQAIRAGQIISRMREFIRSRHPRPMPCDINAVVRESLDLADMQIEDNCLTARTVLAASLPPTQADPTLLAQVVVNLVQNAIDSMKSSSPTRRTLTVATGIHGDGSIVVSVSDQGQGLPDGIDDELYRPFFTTKPQGLGLGLSICRSVVEAHGGRLWHEVNAEHGCTFHFTVPPESPA
jgi:C4-dicarboxylate-specific signal transduction histidine kinase